MNNNIEQRKRYLRQRLLEIIDGYLFNPEEDYADIKMVFKKQNGETQKKRLTFVAYPDSTTHLTVKSVSEEYDDE